MTNSELLTKKLSALRLEVDGAIVDDIADTVKALIRELDKTKALNEKYIEQVRDTCIRAEKAEAFKTFVHNRLDEIGIEAQPDGEHSKEGCRIGDRLDIVDSIRDALIIAAPHHMGGHSAVGWAISEALNITFPINMEDLGKLK